MMRLSICRTVYYLPNGGALGACTKFWEASPRVHPQGEAGGGLEVRHDAAHGPPHLGAPVSHAGTSRGIRVPRRNDAMVPAVRIPHRKILGLGHR